MAMFRALFWRRRRLLRPVEPPEGIGAVTVRYERAWAAAWPHVDDWFKPDAFLLRPAGAEA